MDRLLYVDSDDVRTPSGKIPYYDCWTLLFRGATSESIKLFLDMSDVWKSAVWDPSDKSDELRVVIRLVKRGRFSYVSHKSIGVAQKAGVRLSVRLVHLGSDWNLYDDICKVSGCIRLENSHPEKDWDDNPNSSKRKISSITPSSSVPASPIPSAPPTPVRKVRVLEIPEDLNMDDLYSQFIKIDGGDSVNLKKFLLVSKFLIDKFKKD